MVEISLKHRRECYKYKDEINTWSLREAYRHKAPQWTKTRIKNRLRIAVHKKKKANMTSAKKILQRKQNLCLGTHQCPNGSNMSASQLNISSKYKIWKNFAGQSSNRFVGPIALMNIKTTISNLSRIAVLFLEKKNSAKPTLAKPSKKCKCLALPIKGIQQPAHLANIPANGKKTGA